MKTKQKIKNVIIKEIAGVTNRVLVTPDARKIAENLKEEDYAELFISENRCPRGAALLAWACSYRRWLVYYKNTPVIMFGLARHDNFGVPWLLSTVAIQERAVTQALAANCKKYIEEMHKDFKVLSNCVSEKSHIAIAWLKRSGFTFEKAFFYGSKNDRFLGFKSVRV